MRTILIITLCFFASCGSRRVDKQKLKEYTKIELSEEQHKKVEEFEISKKEVQTSIQEYDLSVFENFNLSYEGQSPDDSVLIEKTDKGVKIKGSGKVNLGKNKEANNKGKTIKQKDKANALKATKSESDEQNSSSISAESEELNKQNEREGSNFLSWIGGLVITIILIVVAIVLGGRLKKV